MSYLSHDHLIQALARGRRVELWIGPGQGDDSHLLRWLCIEREPAPDLTYTVVLKEVYLTGGGRLSEHPVLDVDNPEGTISSFATKEDALTYVTDVLHGSLDRFVKDGEIQKEYDRFLHEGQDVDKPF